ncbi:MAG: hypothetical protein DRR42_24300 [Gammaproteobacteria bacterium]|nr:MAG: hypothetical protein DRR42_24300 [Gammaproteobacteria bacterium]
MHGNRIQRRSRCRTYGILAWQQSESSAISFLWTHSFRVSGSNDPTSQRNSEGMVVVPPKTFKFPPQAVPAVFGRYVSMVMR